MNIRAICCHETSTAASTISTSDGGLTESSDDSSNDSNDETTLEAGNGACQNGSALSVAPSMNGDLSYVNSLVEKESVKQPPHRKKNLGARSERKNKGRSIFKDTTIGRYLETFRIECWSAGFDFMGGGKTDLWSSFETDRKKTLVAVAVEATAISAYDLDMDPNVCCHGVFPQIPGSNLVGVIHDSSSDAKKNGFIPGTRVASLVRWGANEANVSVPTKKLMVVPTTLEATDICCVLATYLPAFQMLHHGTARPSCYSKNCWSGKSILLVGGKGAEAQAAIRIALLGGAERKKIYVTAPKTHAGVLDKFRVNTYDDQSDWLQNVEGKMDVVVDFEFPRNFKRVQAALAPEGRLTCVSDHGQNDGLLSRITGTVDWCYLLSMKRASVFNSKETVENFPEGSRQDLAFLLRLLATRQLRPDIDRFIGLSEVRNAHRNIRSKPLRGSVICEPWKE